MEDNFLDGMMEDNFLDGMIDNQFEDLSAYERERVRRIDYDDIEDEEEPLEDDYMDEGEVSLGDKLNTPIDLEGDGNVQAGLQGNNGNRLGPSAEAIEEGLNSEGAEVGLGSKLLEKAKKALKKGKKLVIALGIVTSGWFIWTVIILGMLGGGLLAIIIPVIAGNMADEFKEAGIDIGDFDLAGLDIEGISLDGITIGGMKETEVVNTGSGSVGSISGSKEEFLAQPIGADYGVNEDKMIADFIANSVKAQSRLGSNPENVKKVMAIVKSNGMSPELFLAYEMEEQGNYWGWLNHTSYVGDPYSDADSVSKWAVSQANSSGPVQLAWYDAAFPIYTTPVELQQKGQAFADALPPGTVGRMYLAGTAAATWGAFDPAALSGSVNGVQDYGDPIQGVMNKIQSWK